MWFAPLFRKQTWSELWIAVRRANRDRRARKFLISVLALIVLFGGWIVLEFSLFRGFFTNAEGRFDPTGLVIACALLAGAGLVFLIHRWTEQRDVTFSLSEKTPAVSTEIIFEIQREAYLLAVLLHRIGSERMMEKELPPQIEVVTRRIHREKLQTAGLWENIPSAMRNLLLLPDGHWSGEQKSNVELCWEYLIVLRWVLRFDDTLRPLSQETRYDWKMVRELFDNNLTPLKAETLASWDMRPERDRADHYFWRYWTEAIARDLVQSEVASKYGDEARRIKAEIDEDGSSSDLLVGAQTVSELKDADLRMMLGCAYRRWQILDLLVPVLSGEKAVSSIRALWTEAISDPAASDSAHI